MDKIRQSFRRKKNKHKQQTENNFDVQNVFDDDLEPRPISRIQKIRQSLRTLKKKKKHNKDTELPVDEDLEAENKFTLDANEEENEEDSLRKKSAVRYDSKSVKQQKQRITDRKGRGKE